MERKRLGRGRPASVNFFSLPLREGEVVVVWGSGLVGRLFFLMNLLYLVTTPVDSFTRTRGTGSLEGRHLRVLGTSGSRLGRGTSGTTGGRTGGLRGRN